MGFILKGLREGKVAGRPEQVSEFVQRQMSGSNANYFVGRFAFGSLGQKETLESIDLLAGELMPAPKREEPIAVAAA